MSRKVVVINESTAVTDAEVQDAAAALQIQLERDFCPIYGGSFDIIWQEKTAPIAGVDWLIVVLDNSDQAGALGYHDLTESGQPLSKVFAKDCIADGQSWTVDLTHEGLEMAADPYINECVQNGSALYAKEVCDACEDDSFGYEISLPNGNKVLVTDFVNPRWFVQAEAGAPPYDFKSHVTKPLQLLVNGYIGYMDLSNPNGWQQLFGEMANDRAMELAKPSPGHRRYLRVIGRENFKRSIPQPTPPSAK